ncbi:hypothetical protein [Kordia sp.]|uniref:hypothetical protein n=1 Tax=Kordia sp. TaxID=1965332 RepID=UPI003B5B632D
MKFFNILEYFLLISTSILLLYNFVATVLFPLKKELFTTTRSLKKIQQVVLIMILIGMIVYLFYTKNTITAQSSMIIIPWIWGFLASHLFSVQNRNWFIELLGLSILSAITIVLFFKQQDINELFAQKSIFQTSSYLYIVYAGLGLLLGRLLWPGNENTTNN